MLSVITISIHWYHFAIVGYLAYSTVMGIVTHYAAKNSSSCNDPGEASIIMAIGWPLILAVLLVGVIVAGPFYVCYRLVRDC